MRELQTAIKDDEVMPSAWGGTGDELEALRNVELMATPMRMSDDVGIAMAKTIRADHEGHSDDIPLVLLGRIDVVSSASGPEVVDAFEREEFRQTGIATLER